MVGASPQKFLNQNNFQLAIFACTVGAAQLPALEPLMEEFKKRELLSRLPHVYLAIQDAEIGEQVHVMFESRNECDC